MPRVMSSAMLAAFSAPYLRPAVLVALGFANETLYIWSGIGPLTWNGKTFLGVGSFGGISSIEEGTSVDARGLTLTLSGIDSASLAEALQNAQIALPVTIYLGLFSGSSLIVDPIIAWRGRMDRPTIDISGTTATIEIAAESRLLDMNVAVDRRYTLEDASIDNPGDLGFQFVSSIQEIALLWGTTPTSGQNI